jgi:hypothetical protein
VDSELCFWGTFTGPLGDYERLCSRTFNISILFERGNLDINIVGIRACKKTAGSNVFFILHLTVVPCDIRDRRQGKTKDIVHLVARLAVQNCQISSVDFYLHHFAVKHKFD